MDPFEAIPPFVLVAMIAAAYKIIVSDLYQVKKEIREFRDDIKSLREQILSAEITHLKEKHK